MCWDARVYGNARVFDNAQVRNAKVSEDAILDSKSWYHNSTLWLHSSTQESLDSFANDKQIKTLKIEDSPIKELIGFDQVENLQLYKLEEFSVKTLPAKLSSLVITSVKILKQLPYLVTQNIKLDTNNKKLNELIPEFTRLQNDDSDKDIAMLEIQQALIEAGFSKEEYEI